MSCAGQLSEHESRSPVAETYPSCGDRSLIRVESTRIGLVRTGPMSEVTRILAAVEQGDAQAANELLPLVYKELRRLAAQRLSNESPGQTLQATALVHELQRRPRL